MSDTTAPVLSGAARPAVRAALWPPIALGAMFAVFGCVTTQAKGLRAGSPWQNDPYDGVVSFTLFLVPAVDLVTLLRMSLLRGAGPQPLYRIVQLLRASALGTVLVAATMATDWLAVAVRADHGLWDRDTPWLIASLLPLSALSLICGLLLWRAFGRLPSAAGRRALEGDWLDDVRPLVDTAAPWLPAPLRRPAVRFGESGAVGSVRRHVVAYAAALSLLAAAGQVTVEAIGEGWTSPVLIGTVTVVAFSTFTGFCLIANTVLRIAVPRDRRAAGGPGAARIRIAAHRALIAVLVAVPVSAFLRDLILSAVVGHRATVDNAAQWAALISISALATGLVAFGAAFAAARPGAHPSR